MEETYGLIVDSSGTRYKTKYDKEDSDDDGLKDNEEISNNGWCEKEGKDHYGNRIYKRYHHMNSDPTKHDSDGDGYFDKNDPRPDESDVTITKLKNDYILIDEGGDSHNISFGGYQGWFEDGTDKGDFISHQGCGLIAASDLILYLSRKDKKFSTPLTDLVPKTDYISLEDYKKFVLTFDALYIRLKWYYPFGIGGINTFDRLKTSKLNDYFEDNYINLKANWGWVENAYFEKVLDSKPSLRTERIKGMIANDIPAIISAESGAGIGKYDIDTADSSLGKGVVYRKKEGVIHNHYFTVTDIIEDKIKFEKGESDYCMYEISSWGQKYYVSEIEIRCYSLPISTNVMYLEET